MTKSSPGQVLQVFSWQVVLSSPYNILVANLQAMYGFSHMAVSYAKLLFLAFAGKGQQGSGPRIGRCMNIA